ncbi:MAG: hypothetical protein C5B54_01525 [Acidobacteria bacterium]|nr:MAG: hypothetical protein C5B54_01525 [Acidobacteriota bacterium]
MKLIHLIGICVFVAGLAIHPLKITRAFFSDEAVYYTMAYSFAYDGDMQFKREDLIRVYKEFSAGPQGIVLKINERDQNIVFGKSYLYALMAAPFVRVFHTNGFFVFYAVLLWLNLLCAYRFYISFMKPRNSLLFSVFYFIANATVIYLYWMTPEYFNMSLICYAFFFFVAGEQLKSTRILLKEPYNYYVAALFFAMATYSKPTNALLIVPLGIWMIYRKKILAAMITFSIFVLFTVALFGINIYFTGDWNYQGGNRAVFYDHFPFERPGASEFAAFHFRKPIHSMVKPPFYLQAFLHNWIYFFFGRFSGLAIYFLPMFFCLVYFIVTKKTSLSVAVYFAGWIGILTYMVGIPWNYFGGSGTIGNRYLLNSFAVLLFAIQQEPSRKALAAGIGSSLLFTTPLLFSPVLSSFDNSFHQERGLLHLLPVEKTLLADLPINTNQLARRVAFDDPANYLLYFMDDNTYYREAMDHYYGFWVKGERSADIVMRTFVPVTKLRLRLKSLAPNNVADIRVGMQSIHVDLDTSQFFEGEINLPKPLPYDRDGTGATYLYQITIHPKKGMVTQMNSSIDRYLGVFVRMELPEAAQKQIPEEEPEE